MLPYLACLRVVVIYILEKKIIKKHLNTNGRIDLIKTKRHAA